VTHEQAEDSDHELKEVPVSDPAEIARIEASRSDGAAAWPEPAGQAGQAEEDDLLP